MSPGQLAGRAWRAVRDRVSLPAGERALPWGPGTRLSTALVVGILSAGTLFDAWLVSCGFAGCPSPAALRAYSPPEGGRVLDRNGRLIGRLDPVNRVNVPIGRIPAHVRQAFIATEDRRFLEHHGVDLRGVARSVVRNVQSLGVREGFSTITMQAARNAFIDEHAALRRSLGRKLIELRLAALIERALDKDAILALYLNEIYLGNGVHGVEAASRDLFGKGVRDVTVGEAAMLAALAKGPSAYSPKSHPVRARQRRDVVLALMAGQGYLTRGQAQRAAARPLVVARRDWRVPQPDASYALDAVRATVDSLIRTGARGPGDLVIHTTLDLAAQRAAQRAVRQHAARIEGDVAWWGSTGDHVQGAMVALDPRTGELRALVGGRDYQRGSFNRAFAARRQPGSAFKPFVYAAALAAGYTPATVVDDEPVTVQLGNDEWSPGNYGDEYRGPVTLRQALAHSANAATVRVSRAVGERNVVDLARRNGIGSVLQAVPAVALGAVEVTPLELVTAYAPFANGGWRVRPSLVRRIDGADGQAIWRASSVREQVMDARDAFQVTSMLRSVVDEGTGTAVRAMGITGPVAGKTGTTNDGTDVWFVGYTPTLVAGFWFGYDTPRAMGGHVNGGRHAAPAWADFYRSGWRERDGSWRAPDGLVAVDIDPATGRRAGEWCHARQREWFRPGSEPTEVCGDEPEFEVEALIDELAGEEWRPLTRTLRRLIER